MEYKKKAGFFKVSFEATFDTAIDVEGSMTPEDFSGICESYFGDKGMCKSSDSGIEWSTKTIPRIKVSCHTVKKQTTISGWMGIANWLLVFGTSMLFLMPIFILLNMYQPDFGEYQLPVAFLVNTGLGLPTLIFTIASPIGNPA